MCSNYATCFFFIRHMSSWSISQPGKSAFLTARWCQFLIPGQKIRTAKPVTVKYQAGCFCSDQLPTWNLLGYTLYSKDLSMQMWFYQSVELAKTALRSGSRPFLRTSVPSRWVFPMPVTQITTTTTTNNKWHLGMQFLPSDPGQGIISGHWLFPL